MFLRVLSAVAGPWRAGAFLSVAALAALFQAAPAADDAPLDVGDRRQLFLDDRFIAESANIVLRMNPAQKLGLVLDAQGNRLQGHVSRVVEDGGKIRLYIGADGLAVYESDDGVRFANTGHTIPGGRFPTLFLDPHDADPARRYKLFWIEFDMPFDPEKHGVYAAHSADGLAFTPDGRVLPYFTDNPCIVWWDPRIGKYVVYTRALEASSENQRRVARIETDDPLKPWPHTRAAEDGMWLTPRNAQVVLAADGEDDPHSDIYYNAATLYPWAQDAYLMFTAQFRHFHPDRQPFIRPRTPGQWEDYGLLEIQLAVSRDGIAWRRPDRSPYFPMGQADEWDRWYATMGPGIARRGGWLYQYYTSSGRTHDSVVLRPEYDGVPEELGGVGVVRQRLDGFFSADADHTGGWLTTPVLRFTGNRLLLNADSGGMGTVFVELRGADNAPLPGFTLADCEEIGGNFTAQTVYWRGSPDVSALAGRPVRIHFKMTRAKLYALQFTGEPAPQP